MKVFTVLIVVIVGVLLFDTVRMYLLFRNTLKLENGFTPFQKNNSNATKKILVLGDSTAVGTGSSDNKYSTTGRLSSQFPDAEVTNISKNGLKIEGLNEKIKNIETKYDIIVIQIGANDIIRLTSYEKIESGLQELLTMTKTLSDNVTILHSEDISESDFFPFYLKPILSIRSKKVRDIYIKNTEKYNAKYVDLINVHMVEKYYSNDKLHLNDMGYGVWFEEIMKKI